MYAIIITYVLSYESAFYMIASEANYLMFYK